MTIRLSGIIVALLAMLFASAAYVRAQSAPDLYEGAPYCDDYSSTRNCITLFQEQTHTVHAETDVDWGTAAQVTDPGQTLPFSLEFMHVSMHPNAVLEARVYLDGPDMPPTHSKTIAGYETQYYPSETYSLAWNGEGTRNVHFSIHVCGSVVSETGYTMRFVQTTAANNGLVGVGDAPSASVNLFWETGSMQAGATGFKVQRSLNADSGYVPIHLGTIPTPVGLVPGPCYDGTQSGCMTYSDTLNLLVGTKFYYRLEVVLGSGNSVPYPDYDGDMMHDPSAVYIPPTNSLCAPPSANPTCDSTPPAPTATPEPCCPGDADNSGGFVDAQDFVGVQLNFGAQGPPGIEGDADCSGGFVDAADFVGVQINFGAVC